MLNITELATYDSIDFNYSNAEFSIHDVTADQENYYAEFFIFGDRDKKKKGWFNLLDLGGLGFTAASLAFGGKKLTSIRNEVKREAKEQFRKNQQKQYFGDKTELEIAQLANEAYSNMPITEAIANVRKNKAGLEYVPDPVKAAAKSFTDANILQAAIKEAGLSHLNANQQKQLFTSVGATKSLSSLVDAALIDNPQSNLQELIANIANRLKSGANTIGLLRQ